MRQLSALLADIATRRVEAIRPCRAARQTERRPARRRLAYRLTTRAIDHEAPKAFAYMAHCHLLEHEDTGMMLGFTV